MRNYLFYMVTFIIMALLASCNESEFPEMENTDSDCVEKVSISAVIPVTAGETRAVVTIPSSHKLRCVLEVWNKEEIPELVLRQEVVSDVNTALPVFEFSLAVGDYDCLLWADFVKNEADMTIEKNGNVTYEHYEDEYYSTDNLHRVTYVMGENAPVPFDTDLCDAFFACMTLQKRYTEFAKVLDLKRATARFFVEEKDATQFVSLKTLRVSYDVPAGFNVATGETSEEKMEMVYEKTFAGSTSSGEEISSRLFGCYLLAPSSGLTLGNITLTFSTTEQEQLVTAIKDGSITLNSGESKTVAGNIMVTGKNPDEKPDRG